MRYSPFLSCRQAARLISAELDRDLTPLERAGLRLHLHICAACPRVVAQFASLRRSVQGWRDGVEETVEP